MKDRSFGGKCRLDAKFIFLPLAQ